MLLAGLLGGDGPAPGEGFALGDKVGLGGRRGHGEAHAVEGGNRGEFVVGDLFDSDLGDVELAFRKFGDKFKAAIYGNKGEADRGGIVWLQVPGPFDFDATVFDVKGRREGFFGSRRGG